MNRRQRTKWTARGQRTWRESKKEMVYVQMFTNRIVWKLNEPEDKAE